MTGPWPAEANENALRIGSRIVISTPSRAVRLATADQLSIHTTEGTEIAAIVLNKSGARMRLSLFDGRYAHLALIRGTPPCRRPTCPDRNGAWCVSGRAHLAE